MNRVLLTGAVLGLTAVILGAYGDHALRGTVSDQVMRSFLTALRYQQLHSVLIAAIGLSLWAPLPHTLKRRLGLAGWVFVAGIVLFATPVFLAAFTGSRAIIMATPVGGLTLMAGWALLIWAAAKKP